MSELEPLIADLALILICAGAMPLFFKRLKQPVVLGYIVAVSVFTTFTTPYMIRLASPAFGVVERIMPQRWRSKLQSYAEASGDDLPESNEQRNIWKAHMKNVAVTVGVNSVLSMAIIALMLYFGKPFITGLLPAPWNDIATALITLAIVAPFLWMLMLQGNNDDARTLWSDNKFSRAKLVALQLLRLLIAAAFVSYILRYTTHWDYMPGIFAVVAVIFCIMFSPRLRRSGERMTQTFSENLTQRERQG